MTQNVREISKSNDNPNAKQYQESHEQTTYKQEHTTKIEPTNNESVTKTMETITTKVKHQNKHQYLCKHNKYCTAISETQTNSHN